MPKPGKKEKRPLGIPTIEDRAKQALIKLALEPEWEAKFESNSHGFRPGRSTHDAIEAIRIVISGKPKYVLDADIAQCFDRINHIRLLDKINTTPKFRRQIKAWLKGGVMENNVFQDTESGTPQGGICSPLLANIALHGMQKLIESQYPAHSNGTIKRFRSKFGRDDVSQPKLIRYADDLVIICDEKRVILHCRQLIEDWLSEIGLELQGVTSTPRPYPVKGFEI
ncbi:MAG: reverse transcriptase/maturase family protein [Cyanobacteria bacterium J06632_19]